MLVIATPKSASSALVETLSKVHGLPLYSSILRKRHLANSPVSRHYWRLALNHGEFVELTEGWASDLRTSSEKYFTKHHFPPTKKNIRALRDIKKLILVREPEGVIRAYRRGSISGAFPLRSHIFAFCFTEQQWLRMARRSGLINELDRFYRDWMNCENTLVVTYEELVRSPERVLERAEEFFGLPLSGTTVLEKAKYSRKRDTASKPSFFEKLRKRGRVMLKYFIYKPVFLIARSDLARAKCVNRIRHINRILR